MTGRTPMAQPNDAGEASHESLFHAGFPGRAFGRPAR